MSANVLDLPDSFTDVNNETGEEHSITAANSREDAANHVTVINRDPADIQAILRLSFASILLCLLLVASAGANVYLYRQGPMLVFKNPEDGRVLQVNNTVFGSADPIKYGADRLTDEDKIYLAKQFTKYLYALDPATRAGDIEKALRMMVPQSAVALFQRMKEGGRLERQALEKWQGVWTPQVVRVNGSDPYKVDVIGIQDVTRVLGGRAVGEQKQLAFTLKLVADPQRRADRNERTGFVVADILDFKEIAGDGSSSSSSVPMGTAPNSELTPTDTTTTTINTTVTSASAASK